MTGDLSPAVYGYWPIFSIEIEAESLFLSRIAVSSLKRSMDNLTLFGKRLRSIRGRRSRASVAEAARISSGYLGELERGEKWPALDIIVELAKVFAVSPGAFFEFESEEVDPRVLRENLVSVLGNKDTKQLQQALRVVKSLYIG
jgi:transcriptional regulator with XRE-family HTH domain